MRDQKWLNMDREFKEDLAKAKSDDVGDSKELEKSKSSDEEEGTKHFFKFFKCCDQSCIFPLIY